ncbi:MAG TPA: hypothetical protein VLM85_11020 [Polyangiaceae bacterium]|nr:hypothetical protein [Polyangiaceae bacterium]
MRQKAIGFVVMAIAFAGAAGACATGGNATDTHSSRDGSAPRPDSGMGNDGSTTPKDSGTTQNDSGTTQKDSSTPIQDGSTCNLTVCGSLCVDTTIDDSNCGSCGHACSGGSTCSNSTCQCSGGMTLCSAVCVDTMTDNSNCGGCGVPCTGGSTCTSGVCQAQSTSNAPPQGSCAHDLCTPGNGSDPLTPGCDPSGCATAVCNGDPFCCSTDWDSICVGEVVTYCPPYSCP